MTTLSRRDTVSSAIASWWRLFWVPVVVAVIAFGYSATIASLHTKALSPTDEWVYSDYLDKVPTEGIVREGEAIGRTALQRIACDGVYLFGRMGQPCGSSYRDLAAFPFKGRTSADAYTPLYFATTWAMGLGFQLLPGVTELTAWRMAGAIWLAATCVALFLLFRRLRVGPLPSAALILAFVASPFSWTTYTFVSTDAPSVLLGAILLILTLRYLSGEGRGWPIPVVGAIAVLFKVTNILGVCLVALLLLLTWLWELRSTDWSRGLASRRPRVDRSSIGLPAFGILAVAAAVAAQLGWLALRAALAVGPAPDQGIGVPFSKTGLLASTTKYLTGILPTSRIVSNGAATASQPLEAWMVVPLGWLCLVGVLAAFWRLRTRSPHGPLVVTTVIAAALFAPMLTLITAVTTGIYYDLPARYGAVLLGAFLLVTGLVLKNRWAAAAVIVYAVALGAATIAGTVTIAHA
jgi:hypothetical protein